MITGAFQTIAGTVKSVDVAANQVVVTNLQTKKDVTVDLGSAIVLKKFPEEMAQRMAAAQAGGAPGAAGGRPAGAGGPPAGGDASGGLPAGGQAGGGRGFGGRSGGIDDMLDRFPTISAADLKAGDMIAVSSTKTDNPDHITAIKFLAGVEPFIRASQAAAAGGGRGGRGSQNAGFTNIPGLDGFDAP